MASEIEKAPRLAKTFEDASDSPPMRCQDGALTVPRRLLDAPRHSNTPQSSHYTPPRAPPERPGGARGVPGMPSRRAQDGPRRFWDVILVPFGILQRAQVASKSYMTGRSCGAFWDATDGPISLQIVSRTTFLLSYEKLWNYYFKSYWTGRAFGAFWDAAEGPNSLQVVSCTMFLLKIRKALNLLVWNMTAMIRWRPNRPRRPRDAPRQLQDAPKLTLGGGIVPAPPEGRQAARLQIVSYTPNTTLILLFGLVIVGSGAIRSSLPLPSGLCPSRAPWINLSNYFERLRVPFGMCFLGLGSDSARNSMQIHGFLF